eukprot:g95.t1
MPVVIRRGKSKAAPAVKTSMATSKPVRQANQKYATADEKEAPIANTASLWSAITTLHALYYVLVSIICPALQAHEQPREVLSMVSLKGMQEWGANINCQDMIGDKVRGCCARAITSALRVWEALRAHHCMSTDILCAILHSCVHPRDAMTKARKKGARAWRHHGKFIFILMLLTMPSSTATRHFEMAGGGGAVVLDDDSLNDANYLIDGKHAVQYGTRFTKTLVHHLEVHGVNAKHESRSGMHRLLDNVLDEMRSEYVRAGDREHTVHDQRKVEGEDISFDNQNEQWHQDHGRFEAQRVMQSEEAQGRPLPPSSRISDGEGLAAPGIMNPNIDASRESSLDLRGVPFETCWRVQSLLTDLANATNVGIKEGSDLITQVETYVEEFTPCQTATSSCLAKGLRDSASDTERCVSVAELREGTCKEVGALQRRIEAVIEKYSGLGTVDNVRTLLGKIREDCKAVVPHGRRLAECPTIPTSGYYELTADCSLSSTITVPANKTLTIVGIGNPTIDRGEGGRHFIVNGHLNMTGVTLTKGKDS